MSGTKKPVGEATRKKENFSYKKSLPPKKEPSVGSGNVKQKDKPKEG